MNKFISLLYSLLIGASIVTFVGLGVYAFYPGQSYDKDCYELHQNYRYDYAESSEPSPEDDNAFNECQTQRDNERQDYARIVAIIGLVATAGVTAAALFMPITINEIKDGIALGAVMTAIYSAIWAGIAEHRVLMFISGTLFLASAITTGYAKFKD